MSNIEQLIAETERKGGGRVPHIDRFLDHVSDEHADELRGVLHGNDIGDAHVSRVLCAFRDADYPEFRLGMSEGAVRTWRASNR